MVRWVIILMFAGVLLSVEACQETPLTKKKEPQSSTYVPLNYQRANGLSFSKNPVITNEQNPVEQIDAISRCNCGEQTKLKYFRSFNSSKGVLPQILVPSIREEIRNNSKLQMLNALPPGLGSLLAGIFATDDKITDEISTKLGEKLSQNAPGGTSLGRSPKVRLDGFVPLSPVIGTTVPNAFNLSEQIVRWSLVFSTPHLYDGNSGVGGADQGPQTLELMRAMMEWNYMFGLDPRPEGGQYGGISLDASGDVNRIAGPFDPRVIPNARRFFSGTYSLFFPPGTNIQLATQAQEMWRVQHTTPILLQDQARLWSTAAFAFGRLRPEKRSNIQGMFGQKGVALFPQNAHELPLAFLSTLQSLLEGPFISKDARAIYKSARVGSFQSDDPATVSDIAYLMDALVNWTVQLRSIDTAQVRPEVAQRLSATPARFVPALQLAANRVLADHFVVDERQVGITIRSLNPSDPTALAHAGRVLYALARTEREIIESPFIRDRVIGGFHWYAANILQPYLAGNKPMPFAGAVWSLRAMMELRNYDPTVLQAPWINDAIQRLEAGIASWDQQNQ